MNDVLRRKLTADLRGRFLVAENEDIVVSFESETDGEIQFEATVASQQGIRTLCRGGYVPTTGALWLV
jgi:hypothetical protein